MAKKIVAKCIVSLPRAGEILVNIPIEPQDITGRAHGLTVDAVNTAALSIVTSKVKVKVTNGREVLKALKNAG